MTAPAMTVEDARRMGRERAIAIYQMALLVGRDNEASGWVSSELTVDQVWQRLYEDKFGATSPRPVNQMRAQLAPVPSSIEAMFERRGLRLAR